MKFTFDREYQLQIHHTKVSVVEWGDENAEPLLCLHGWLDNAASFHYLAPYLKDKYRLIALEFPGHGQSEHLAPSADYQFVSGVAVIDGALDALNIDQCKVLAHSMGGGLAMIHAGAVPNRITKLVTIDAFGPFSTPAEDTAKQLAEAIEHRKKTPRNKRYFENVEHAAKARSAVSELSPELLMPMVERGVVRTEHGFQWSSDARLTQASWLRMTEEQITHLFNNIESKVCFIYASKGILVGIDLLEERLKTVASVERIDMEGGHHLHMEFAKEVSEVVLKFLN